ncbi:MAG TPA: DinB family protein [Chthonomonadaceae bacterium]|nr:DinB family protein [Chthonomonadaceae bacterium]
MLPPFVRKYLLTALEGTPDVLDGFLKTLPADDPVWDFRPAPARFTLREVVAHLADWEPIFLERMTRIRDESEPSLPDIDEGQLAIDRDYAHSDPQANLARFRQGRVTMLAFLRSLKEGNWERAGNYKREHPMVGGPVTLEAWVAQVVGHDGYHTQQVAQWLAAARR